METANYMKAMDSQTEFRPLCEKTKIGLDLAIVQISLTLGRLGKGKKTRDEFSVM